MCVCVCVRVHVRVFECMQPALTGFKLESFIFYIHVHHMTDHMILTSAVTSTALADIAPGGGTFL